MFLADFPSNSLVFFLSKAEKELLDLLRQRGVSSVCESITKEINYAWAVLSGFKTLADVGHFYFACGGETFGYNPAVDFFNSKGMQLALFALQKYVHNEHVLLQALECMHIYSKLHGGSSCYLPMRFSHLSGASFVAEDK